MREIRTNLICSRCFKESPVRITYLGDSIVQMRCENCGNSMRVHSKSSVPHFSLKEWERRIVTKPVRVAMEAQSNPLRFISSFPFRLLTKPLRVSCELQRILN